MEGAVLVIHILDMKSENIVATIENKEQAPLFWNDTHLQQLKDNIETFDFTMQANVPAAENVTKRNRVIIPDEDGFFREFIIEAAQQLSNKTKEVYTSASFSELAKQKILNPVTLNGQTVISAGEYVLQGTEWKLGITEFSGSRTIEFPEHINALKAIRDVANIFELELRFRVEIKGNRIIARYVDMIQRVGNVTGKEIVLGKDLIGVTRKEHSADIVTALLGLGPEKEDGTRLTVIVEDKEALERWGRNGRHLWDVYSPETSDLDMTLERLTDLTEAALKKRVNTVVEFEADAASIEHIFGFSHERVRLGDTNRLKDTSYSPALFLDARIISVERSISDPSQKKFILGDFIEYTEEEIMKTFKALKAVLQQKASEQEVQAAQATADKKVQTFFSSAEPTAESVGDLWYNTTTFELKRWDGSAWNLVSDVTGQKTAADTAKVNGIPAVDMETKTGAQGKADNAEAEAKEQANFYTKVTSGINKVKDMFDPANYSTVYQEVLTEMPDGSHGHALYKKHTAGQAINNGRIYITSLEVDPTKTYLIECWVKPLDTNSRYYIGHEEFDAAGNNNDQGNGPYGVNGRTPLASELGTWLKHYYLIMPHDAGAADSHTPSTQSTLTPNQDVKFYNANTARIDLKIYLTYSPTDTNQNSEMFATNIALYQVGADTETLTKVDDTKNTVDTNKDTWDRASNINSDGTFNTDKLLGAINTATNKIQADSNFYWEGGTLIAIDPNNTNNRVKISSGGIGVSTDGGQTYSNALTGSGLVAEATIAGVITGVEIDGGIFRSSDLDSQMELSDGNGVIQGPAGYNVWNQYALQIGEGDFGTPGSSNVIFLGNDGGTGYIDSDAGAFQIRADILMSELARVLGLNQNLKMATVNSQGTEEAYIDRYWFFWWN